MARSDQPEQDRKDFYLFIDEFHNFTTDAFTAILAEARKYRLNLTLSHQYIEQLSLPVRQAVFGNVGTLISFRVGHSDAEALANEFGDSYVPEHFIALDRYEALVKPMEDGVARQPIRARTLPPINTNRGRRQKLIARSREKYACRREVIESKLNRWIADKTERQAPC